MLLSSIRLKNILSFKDTTLELGPLNVLIGPNASGKSNLIEVIGLLQAAPSNLGAAILRGGGIRAWVWKGMEPVSESPELECRLPWGQEVSTLLYELRLQEETGGFIIGWERLQGIVGAAQTASDYFNREMGSVTLVEAPGQPPKKEEVPPSESVLARFKNPLDPSPIARVGRQFENIRIYHEFSTGPLAQARSGISAAAPKQFLLDGGHNLATVLQEMTFDQSIRRVNEYLARLSDGLEEVLVRLEAGNAQVYIREQGLNEPILGTRLSDGTLKLLSLLAVLLHAQPPPLVCLEEPEIGLHPDALQLVAEALVDASARCQLIVTTHSPDLVDALSDHPEAIVVCERDFDYGTQFKRLKPEELEVWLERYRLGELWRKGVVGGNRW